MFCYFSSFNIIATSEFWCPFLCAIVPHSYESKSKLKRTAVGLSYAELVTYKRQRDITCKTWHNVCPQLSSYTLTAVQICSCLLNHFHKTLREFFLNLLPAKSKVENKTNIAKLKGMFNRMETVVIGNKCQKIF